MPRRCGLPAVTHVKSIASSIASHTVAENSGTNQYGNPIMLTVVSRSGLPIWDFLCCRTDIQSSQDSRDAESAESRNVLLHRTDGTRPCY